MEEKYNRLIEIFREISKIPRNSKKEDKIGEYIVNFAKKLGLEARIDEMYNVVVKRKSSKGLENSKKIIFQAHTDMVCEKGEKSSHDFDNDAIEIIEENNILKAKDTTLGADDGIGVSMLLLLMEDKDIKLPECYFVFTTQEEIGMNGARFLDYSDIVADYLINLDGEEENTAIVGCAGGITIEYTKSCNLMSIGDGKLYKIEISDLYGGHSGVDINKNRINSNYLAAKILENTNSKIISFVGGNKDNAIPNNTKVIFETKENMEEKLEKVLSNITITQDDKDGRIELEELEYIEGNEALTEEETSNFLSLILNLKQGVIKMSDDIEDLVETSGNIGIVRIEKGNVKIIESLRSSIDSQREKIEEENNLLALGLGYNIREGGEYPGWKYNPNSFLERVYKESYKETHNGKEPIICAIHAGVECGMIYEKLPNLDMISLGPDVVDVHTINETLYLDSCKKILQTLTSMIEKLK